MEEITSNPCTAETLYVNHPESSYGTFCFNSIGDLFLNSDWGFHGYAWRHYGGKSFKEFLGSTNPQYIVGKFAINYLELSRKKMPKHMESHLQNLVAELIKYCKES